MKISPHTRLLKSAAQLPWPITVLRILQCNIFTSSIIQIQGIQYHLGIVQIGEETQTEEETKSF